MGKVVRTINIECTKWVLGKKVVDVVKIYIIKYYYFWNVYNRRGCPKGKSYTNEHDK